MQDNGFGQFIYQLRTQRGLSQRDFGGLAGVSERTVSKWERGKTKPKLEVLYRIARVLGVRAEDLMAGRILEESEFDPNLMNYLMIQYKESQRKLSNKRLVKILIPSIAAIIITFGLIIAGFVALFIGQIKKSESYRVATEFVTDVFGDDVSFKLAGFSVNKEIKGGKATGDAYFKFIIEGEDYNIYLEMENSDWYVVAFED